MNVAAYSVFLRRWLLVGVLPAILLGALTYTYVHRQPAMYQASSTLYVQVPSISASGAVDPLASQEVIPTFTQMIDNPTIVDAVQQRLQSRYPGFIFPGVTTSQPGLQATSQLLTLTYTDSIAQRAVDAVNATAQVFIARVARTENARFVQDERSLEGRIRSAQQKILTVSSAIAQYHGPPSGLGALKASLQAYQLSLQGFISSLQQFRVSSDSQKNSVSVYAAATRATTVHSTAARDAGLAVFVVLLLGALLVYLHNVLDDSLRSQEQVEDIAGAPILGTIRQFNRKDAGDGLIVVTQPQSSYAEAYRHLRTNITFAGATERPRALVITSAQAREGKSTTASNLARVFAEGGTRVVLVDADLRRPSLHRLFDNIPGAPGLTNVLAGHQSVNAHGAIQQGDSLRVLAAGPLPPRPADLLGSPRVRELITHLEQDNDLVLLDSPPILAVTDAVVLSASSDGVILVVNLGRTRRRELVQAREALEAVHATLVGVVINELTRANASYYYGYRGYNYAGAYSAAAPPGPETLPPAAV